MQHQHYQIFISYRRNGSDAHARIFYEKLRDAGYNVFLDFESLISGGFKVAIKNVIEECSDFILLLPQGGLEKCLEPDDVFLEEIIHAIENKKNIIPVYINGFRMENYKNFIEERLPEIKTLIDIQGIDCSMEYFDAVFEKLLRYLTVSSVDNYLFTVLKNIKENTLSLNHDYFKKWAYIKLNQFISENNEFWRGTNWTNPHAEDTFGINGIGFTQLSIKALSTVNDYWNDSFSTQYLKKQEEILEQNIEIYRIFIIEKDNWDIAQKQMEYQKNLGINVYYIEKENEYIDPEWLKEDYLIQDDELLVQIYCNTHQFNSEKPYSEKITTDIAEVKTKLERFQRILERAQKFEI